MKKIGLIFSILILLINPAYSQKINPDLLENVWDAKWISHPEAQQDPSGVYLFKKIITLTSVPEEFIIHLSADNRYKFYVNGHYICNGPARGDFLKWRFETVDLAPYLKDGENIVCTQVFNLGNLKPVAQFSNQIGLIIQGNHEKEEIINTDKSWRVLKDPAYAFKPVNSLNAYYVTGPIEIFDSSQHPWDWQANHFDNDDWIDADELSNGASLRSMKNYGNFPQHALFPREIPLMEYTKQFFSKVRKCEGLENANNLIKGKDLQIPANSKVTILLDQGHLTNAYPNIHFSQGKEASIQLTYAEALFETRHKDGKETISMYKGNRNEIKGKKIIGNYDMIICDGQDNRMVEPLWWRTFRYVQVEITTEDEPLTLHEISSQFTGYPLIEKANFESDNKLHTNIWNIGWRTQRLCAGETFFDCPYYEQLQYVGDTRIQSLVTCYVSGDTLLWRKAITDYYDSRLPFGLTQSRYPSNSAQLIPTFSLLWIAMLNDYMTFCNDGEFIKSKLPAVMDILNWFEDRLENNHMPGHFEGWTFIDWVISDGWQAGMPPMDSGKHSAVIGLQVAYAAQKAAEMYNHFGLLDMQKHCLNLASNIKKSIYKSCWDVTRNMLSDTPEKTHFSQHANIFAVLTNAIPEEIQAETLKHIYEDNSIAQASYYFRFYLAEALKKAGLGDMYTETLKPWEIMIQNGLTTFAEEPEPSRSDCHAWSASPLFHFLSIVCGIEPAAPAFEAVKITPHLGSLKSIKGEMPHKYGNIQISLKKSKRNGIKGNVILPEKLHGTFYWNQTQIPLKSGVTKINIQSSKNNMIHKKVINR